MWIPGQTPQFYPLVFTTFRLEYQLWELHLFGYHVVNVLLHGANAALLWRLLCHLRITGAWMIAAVWAFHPVQVESVAYISELKNVQSAFFYLLSMLTYLRFEQRREGAATESKGYAAWAWYGAALLLFVAALLSKTVTFTLPIVMIIIFIWQGRAITLRRLWPLAPFLLVGLLLALQTAKVEQATVGAVGPEFQFTLAQRLLIACRALLFYPWKLLWPADLTLIYPRWEFDAGDPLAWWPVGLVGLIAILVTILFARGMRAPALALAFSAVTISPALGFVSYYPMRFSYVADHFQYLACLGVITLLVGAGAAALRGRRLAPLLGAGLLAVLATLSAVHASTFASAATFWRHTLAVNDRAWIAHHNFATLLAAQGHSAEAEDHFRRAIDLNDDADEMHRALGDLLLGRGRTEEALREYRRALECVERVEPALVQHAPAFRDNPPSAQYHLRIGQALNALGRATEAEAALRAALAIAPHRAELNAELAAHLTAHGRFDEAATILEGALRIRPESAPLQARLADAYRALGRLEEALQRKRAALEFAANEQERLTALRDLADLLATCTDDRIRNGAEATALAEQVVRRTARREPSSLMTLAAAYAELGRFPEAVALSEEAFRLARSIPQHDLAAQIEKRLTTIRAGKPVRE